MPVTAKQQIVAFPSGEKVPALGLGTWRMGENKRHRADEIGALRSGIDLGMTVIDTAEMYGDGATEELVGEALEGRRDQVFLVSKVLPNHARRSQVLEACAASLERLRTDHLDLYLLHWRGSTPLRETVDAFAELVADGRIRRWGVSNFDVSDMIELVEETPGGKDVACNQVLYNLTRRGIELELLGWCRERRIPIMAYSPIEQGRLLRNKAVKRIADKHNATPAQICLAWVLRQRSVIAIPKAGTTEHVRENHNALAIELTTDDLRELDEAFPAPRERQSLEMI